MRYRVGKCPVCSERAPIVESYSLRLDPDREPINLSARRVVMGYHQAGTPAEGCRGRWMEPACDEKLDRERFRRAAKKRALVEPFRIHATVAHDAWCESRPFPRLDLRILLAVAVQEYKLSYPNDATTTAAIRYVGAKSGGRGLRVGDCYCSFCGELLLRGVKSARFGRMEPERLRRIAEQNHHAVRCALEHLAHGLRPAPPETRRLAPELLAESL